MVQQLHLFDDLGLYEGPDVEYKGAKGGLPSDLWATYSAFANTDGGTLFLGVTQRSDRLDIHGVENPEKLTGDFWNTINNRGKVNRNLLSNQDVQQIPLQGIERSVIVIRVPRAGRRERPVYVGSDPFRGTYRRNFEGDYRCTEDEVRRMFADQSEEPTDSRILSGFGADDLHLDSIRQFRNRFASYFPNHPWLSEDDRGLLVKLGAWRRDRQTGIDGPTLAGMLMFGRSEAITDPTAIPGYHLDYRERLSDDPEVRWTDRLTLDGTWEGNLFQFYQRVVLKLSTGPGLKLPFQRDAEGYRRVGTPVHEALQEALVNALIHADYSGQGGIVIDRHVDRFEFSNPGTLLVSREQLLRGGISECRNKSLQKMFQMLGVGDKAGSGIDKIRSSWAAQHWQSPSLRETYRPDRVMLVLPMISTFPEDVLRKLNDLFGESFRSLSSDEVQAVVTAEIEGGITNQRLQEMLSLHRVDITRMLRGLVGKGFLLAEGFGRGTRYTLNTAGGVSLGGEVDSPPKAPPDNEDTPPTVTTAPGMETELDAQLLAIAAPIRARQRAKPEELRAVIVELCERRFLTVQQLARLLGRAADKLQERYVSGLVREGKLEPRYPDVPNHPDQAYRTRKGSTEQGEES